MQEPFASQNTFFNDTVTFHTSRGYKSQGVEGELVPYSVSNDNFITSLLIFFLITFIVSVAHSHRFLKRQAKNFFFMTRNEPFSNSETSAEVRFQIFLSILSVMLTAIAGFQYTMKHSPDSFLIDYELQLLTVTFLILITYHTARLLLFTMVNLVFFSPRQNASFLKSQIFIYAAQSLFLFPTVLMVIYFNIPLEKSVYFFIILFILSKFLSFFKAWSIFFREKGNILQTFLYFCTLEIVPLLCLTSILVVLINNMKLIF